MKTHKSFALENIRKYKQRQRKEALKVGAVMLVEALTALAIFTFGYLYFSIAI